jgi:hypothetical protein
MQVGRVWGAALIGGAQHSDVDERYGAPVTGHVRFSALVTLFTSRRR